jgi:hypothetical protein
LSNLSADRKRPDTGSSQRVVVRREPLTEKDLLQAIRIVLLTAAIAGDGVRPLRRGALTLVRCGFLGR